MVLANRSLVCSGPLLELYFTACEGTSGGLPTKTLTRTMLVVGAGRAPRPKPSKPANSSRTTANSISYVPGASLFMVPPVCLNRLEIAEPRLSSHAEAPE